MTVKNTAAGITTCLTEASLMVKWGKDDVHEVALQGLVGMS